MAQTIKLKRSATQNAVPSTSSLALGELAINTYDGKLFIKKNVSGTESIVTIGEVGANSIGPTELASTAVTAGSYGSTSAIPVITIDADGRITSASTATISGLSANSVTSTEIAANAVGISELNVSDGTDGQVLTTDGSGNLAFEDQSGGAASATAFSTNIASGNGSTTAFTLSESPSAESKIIAFINGVFQNQDAYTISGTTITFDTAPISGTNNVVVYVIGDVYSGESVLISNFSGDASTTAFTLANNPGNENNTQVYIDGVYQQKTTYSVSGTTLTFSSAPPTGTNNIEVVMLTSTTVNTPAAGSVVTASMADDSVTGAKIVSSAVTTAKIADSNVTTAKIADSNVTTAKIADDAVTIAKIADAALVIESEGISSNDNDTTLPTSAAVKDYVDTQVAGKDALSELSGDTDDVTEGSTNLYFTNARADARITNALKDEDNMASNSATHIPSQQSVKAYVDSQVASKDALSELSGDTDDVTEGSTNLYYTDARVGTYISGNRTYGNITTTGYIAGPSTFTIDPAAVGNNTGTLVIAGNLQVDGTTTTINSTTMTVDDLNITLASGAANAAAANGAGITVDTANATITYDGTNDRWDFNKDINVTSRVLVGEVKASGNQTFTHGTGSTVNFRNSSAVSRLLINASGNVGIGMSPTYRLDVTNNSTGIQGRLSSSSSSGTSLSFQNSATNGRNYRIGANFVTGAGEFSIYDDTASAERLRISSTGNVGIGQTSPRNDTSTTTLHIGNSSIGTAQLVLEDNDADWRIKSNESLIFNDGTTEIMRLDPSGNLLVGTTDTILDAQENEEQGVDIRPAGFVKISRSNNFPLQLARTNDGDIIKFRSNENTVGSIGTANSGDLYIGNDDTTLLFAGGSDAIIPRGTAGATRDGAISLGLSSHRFNNLHLSGTAYAVKADINISTNARLTINDIIGEVGSGNVALQAQNSAGSALKPMGFRAEDIRFATGSSERMRLDSSGDLNMVNSGQSSLNYTTDGSLDYARIQGGKYGSGVGDLRFFTYSGGLGERMRINAAGGLSINDDIETPLSITRTTTTTGASYMTFANAGGNAFVGVDSSAGNRMFVGGSSANAYALTLTTESAHPILFATNNSQRMSIASDGKIDMYPSGAETTGGLRVVYNGDNNYEVARFQADGDYDAHVSFRANGTNDYYWSAGIDYSDSGAFKISNDNLLATNNELRIGTNGDVSLAANATGAALIKGISGNQADRNAGGYPQYTFVGNEGTGMRRVASNELAFDTSGDERVRIDADGNVGIGYLAENPPDTLMVKNTTSSQKILMHAASETANRGVALGMHVTGTGGGAAIFGTNKDLSSVTENLIFNPDGGPIIMGAVPQSSSPAHITLDGRGDADTLRLSFDYGHPTMTSRGANLDFRLGNASGSATRITTNYWPGGGGDIDISAYGHTNQILLHEGDSGMVEFSDGYIKLGGYSYVGEDLVDNDSLHLMSDYTENIIFGQRDRTNNTWTESFRIDRYGNMNAPGTIVQTVRADVNNVVGTGDFDVISVNITPKFANSDMIIHFYTQWSVSTNDGEDWGMKLLRDGTTVQGDTINGYFISGGGVDASDNPLAQASYSAPQYYVRTACKTDIDTGRSSSTAQMTYKIRKVVPAGTSSKTVRFGVDGWTGGTAEANRSRIVLMIQEVMPN